MIKVVYVLTASLNDYYYEQFFLSYTSLRLHSPKVDVYLLVDEETFSYINDNHNELLNELECISVSFKKEYSTKERSRILKCTMRKHIQGDFLYIDCDTIVCTDISSISKIQHTSAVLDNHELVNEIYPEFLRPLRNAEQFGFSVGFHKKHFNSGVMWCKDNEETHELFDLWYQLWLQTNKNGIVIDQLSLNEANNRLKGVIHELAGEWNCQLRYGFRFIHKAKIIHYFASVDNKTQKLSYSFLLSDKELLKKIRQENRINLETMKLLKNPKDAFAIYVVLEVGSFEHIFLNSNYMSLARYCYLKIPNIYKKIDKWIGMLRTRYCFRNRRC